MSAPPEFTRPRRLDTLGGGGAQVTIEADAAEREALARRFGLKSLDRLTADYRLHRDAAGVTASGTLVARAVQACIATGADVAAAIDEPFSLRFVAAPAATGDEEVELDEGDMDTVFFDGGAIDLGEAAAETLALALDPYPRAPGAGAALREAGVLDEDEARPRGALAGLRDLMDKRGG